MSNETYERTVELIAEEPRPIGAALNRDLGSPTALGEDVEATNDAFIEKRHRDHQERVRGVKRVIARGAAEIRTSMLFETDCGLGWDPEREVWTSSAGDAFAHDGRYACG